MEPLFLNFLRDTLGIKGIKKVSMHEPLTNIRKVIAIVCERDMQTTEVWRAMYGAAVLHRAAGKFVIAINDDIDPTNADALLWAMSYRANASLDIHVMPHRDQGHGPRSLRNNGEDASVLIDATLKEDFPPISLPKREYMERAKVIWEELGLPKLKPKSPWFGYSLGEWSPEFDEAALRATRGDYFDNAKGLEQRRRKDVRMNTEVRRVQGEDEKVAALTCCLFAAPPLENPGGALILLDPLLHQPHPDDGMRGGRGHGRCGVSLSGFGGGCHHGDRNQQGYAGQNARHGFDDLGLVPALHGRPPDQAGGCGARRRDKNALQPVADRGLTPRTSRPVRYLLSHLNGGEIGHWLTCHDAAAFGDCADEASGESVTEVSPGSRPRAGDAVRGHGAGGGQADLHGGDIRRRPGAGGAGRPDRAAFRRTNGKACGN